MQGNWTIAVIGLGYVGLPLAVAFTRKGYKTICFDIDHSRIDQLQRGHDRTMEFGQHELRELPAIYTADPDDLTEANIYIITVPTPVDGARRPDLRAILSASRTVGKVLSKGDIVVYESTVFPGATEEDCVPVLERESGLVCGRDFTVGYSPERINPGDKTHRLEDICKVVAGQDERTRDILAALYGSVVRAGIHVAPSIKVAEAAKVIENSQRDINIAFMNELSEIFERLGIDTGDVLAAARTKWNFLPFFPGLVGGHCIGVDPYYLTYRSEREGYHPQVILSGRRINDSVGQRIARECIRMLLQTGRSPARVAVLGLTFKEDVPDLRNSKAAQIVFELRSFGVAVEVADPLASPADAEHEYGIAIVPVEAIRDADAIIVAVSHREYVERGWELTRSLLRNGSGIVMDVRGVLDRSAKPDGVRLWRL
jgi:UDP-N-acetyl-D-galactosamine dehydrogenase